MEQIKGETIQGQEQAEAEAEEAAMALDGIGTAFNPLDLTDDWE